MTTRDSLRQCIETFYLGPTDTLGARIAAKADCGRVTLSWDHSLDSDENHASACRALMEKKNWRGEMVGGWIGNRCYWVFANDGEEV
jgi:hypothetical protein